MYFSWRSGESDRKDALKAESLLHAEEEYLKNGWSQVGLNMYSVKKIVLKNESLRNSSLQRLFFPSIYILGNPWF